MEKNWKKWEKKKIICKGSGGIYGLGFVGAAVYYIQQASEFWPGVLGILKAIVWPVFVVYKILGM